MKLTDIPGDGCATVACSCGHALVAVDRYITDFPPIPRGRNPESFVEFYRDHGGDPDDLLTECPGCGEYLDLSTVEPIGEPA